MIFINHRCNFWRSICPWPCPIRLTAPGCGKALFSSWATSKTITITFLIKFDRWYFYLKIEQDQHYMYKFKAANNALFKGFQFSGARKRPWGNWAERVCLPWYTLVYHHHGIPWYVYHHHGTTTTDLEDSISVRASHKKTPLNRFNPTHRDLPDWVVIIIIPNIVIMVFVSTIPLGILVHQKLFT